MSFATEKLKIKQTIQLEINNQIESLFFDYPIPLKLLKETTLAAMNAALDEIISSLGIDALTEIGMQKLEVLKAYDIIGKAKAAKAKGESFSISGSEIKAAITNYINTDPTIRAINSQAQGVVSTYTQMGMDAMQLAKDEISQIIQAGVMVYDTIMKMIDLFSNTEFPSPFRMSYITELIKTISNTLNIDGLIDQVKGLVKTLTSMEALMLALAAAFAMYLANKKKNQEETEILIKDFICPDLIPINPIIDVSIRGPLTNDDIDLILKTQNFCNINEKDDIIVPSKSFELIESEFSCSIPSEPVEPSINVKVSIDLASNAIIENSSGLPFSIKVKTGMNINEFSILGNLIDTPIYSPVIGTITNVELNKITLSNISDPAVNILEENITLLSSKYTELNDVNTFLKTWEIPLLYLTMMKNSYTLNGAIIADPEAINDPVLNYNMYTQYAKIFNYWNNSLLKTYETNIQNITGESNVTIQATNESLDNIKIEIDNQNKIIYDYLYNIRNNSKTIANITVPDNGEFILIDYFLINLLLPLQTIKIPSIFEKELINQLNIYINERYVLDGYQPNNISSKINDLIIQLNDNKQSDWFNEGLTIYNTNKNINDVKDWLNNIALNNISLSTIEIDIQLEIIKENALIAKIIFLYQFYLNIEINNEKFAQLKNSDDKIQLLKEAKYIETLLETVWGRFYDLPKEIKEISDKLDSLSNLSIYSIITINDIQYRYYCIPKSEPDCILPSINSDPNLGGATITDFKNIKYWIKYFSIATLVGAANPLAWSTGIILPIGPLLLPVVYIPFKSIQTEYGFIVLGLTITGLYFYPFVLYVNYSTSFTIPAMDPTAYIKEEIKNTKLTISDTLSNLKTSSLKPYMDKLKNDVDAKKEELFNINSEISDHKLKKPPDTKKAKLDKIKWDVQFAILEKNKLTINKDLFLIETKYSLIYDAYTFGKSTGIGATDPTLISIQSIETFLNAQLDALSELVTLAENIIIPLPITLAPNSANFMFTAKNPKPIIQIANTLAENIDDNMLKVITDPIKQSTNIPGMPINNDLMFPGGMMFNYKLYMSTIAAAIAMLIVKDPFPAYEKLNTTNPAWYANFLLFELTPIGAQTFGIPSMPPFPLA